MVPTMGQPIFSAVRGSGRYAYSFPFVSFHRVQEIAVAADLEDDHVVLLERAFESRTTESRALFQDRLPRSPRENLSPR
jgi:hypothetical protein